MKLRQILVIFAALLIIGYNLGQRVQASTIAPGSADDPIISVGYVKNYLAEAVKPISSKLTEADKALKYLTANADQLREVLKPEIVLVIGRKTAKINKKTFTLETAPIVYKGKTILPLRFIGEALHAEVIWDGKTSSVTYKTKQSTIVLRLNNPKAIVNGKTVSLDVPPLMRNKRVLVPVRFVGENLNAQVQYISSSKTVVIR